MKKGILIVALVVASCSALFAGNGLKKKQKQKEQPKVECCDKTKCCPAGTTSCPPPECKPTPNCN